ncbi:MAG: hypothetical protein ACOY0R_12155 [Chloroflexota bacterium]
MQHPLEFVHRDSRKQLFFTFLLLTLGMFAIFQALDTPMKTPAAPNGIVSYELAGTVEKSAAMLASWDESARLNVAFGLGFDYLFMPIYAIFIALATLLAAGRHQGWLRSLGAAAGWGAFLAALFDAVENFALWHILSYGASDPWPGLAAVCASIKFFFFIAGILYAAGGGLIPRQK